MGLQVNIGSRRIDGRKTEIAGLLGSPILRDRHQLSSHSRKSYSREYTTRGIS
jgi:hypothetical protein